MSCFAIHFNHFQQIKMDYMFSSDCRGDDFRPEYRRVAMLRSLFSGCAFMALSATLTDDIIRDVSQHLLLDHPETIAVLPDR
jgi:superfamily II DNA helicase RecQ